MSTFMKTLGIIGGMGPQASIRFMELVIQKCTNDFGIQKNEEFPRILLSNLPAPDIISDRSRETDAGSMIRQEALCLENAGADFLVMTCNTMHLLKKQITENVSIPFLSIIDTVVQHVVLKQIKCVGLLGSITTMTSDLYIAPLTDAGINVIIPGANDRAIVGNCIMSVIAGTSSIEDSLAIQSIIRKLERNGTGSVILGCTELPLLIRQNMTPVPILDSLDLLADASCREIFRVS